MSRRIFCTVIGLGLIPIGIVWRMAPLHLPGFLYKYGGSVLWAGMVYWLVAAVFPRVGLIKVAVIAAVIAGVVEFSRLVHFPALDDFRMTLAGKLILGRYFSAKDIVAYWLAIFVSAALDNTQHSTLNTQHSG